MKYGASHDRPKARTREPRAAKSSLRGGQQPLGSFPADPLAPDQTVRPQAKYPQKFALFCTLSRCFAPFRGQIFSVFVADSRALLPSACSTLRAPKTERFRTKTGWGPKLHP